MLDTTAGRRDSLHNCARMVESGWLSESQANAALSKFLDHMSCYYEDNSKQEDPDIDAGNKWDKFGSLDEKYMPMKEGLLCL